MKLDAKALGLSMGIFCAASMTLLTILSLATGLGRGYLASVMSIYPGYTISLAGIVVGAIYSVIYGFITGYAVAYIYNKLAK